MGRGRPQEAESAQKSYFLLRKSLLARLVGTTLIVTLILCIFLAVYFTNMHDNRMMQEYVSKAEAFARTVAHMINGEEIDSYLDTLEKDDRYFEMLEHMQMLQREHGITYLFISKMTEGGQIFVIDADEQEPLDLGEFLDWESGLVTPEDYSDYFNTLLSGGRVEPVVNDTALWGLLLSVYEPIFYADGSVAAYAGADISIDFIDSERRALLSRYSMIGFILFIAIGTMNLLIIRRFVIRPINLLCKKAESFLSDESTDDILSFDKAALVPVLSHRDEFSALEHSLIELKVRAVSEITRRRDAQKTHQQELERQLNVLESILNASSALICVTVPETGELLFLSEDLKNLVGFEGDIEGRYCYKVLEGLDERCGYCPYYQLENNQEEIIVWEQHIKDSNRYIRKTAMLIDWPGGKKAHLEYGVDVTDIHEVGERVAVMLNAMPICCNLWSKDFKLIDCNESSLRLFGFNDKQSYIENVLATFPELQPDGSPSALAALRLIKRALQGEYIVTEWMHLTAEGEPMPTEITITKVMHGGEDTVAVYIRDLREHNKMMVKIEHRDSLLQAVNQAATLLFTTKEDEAIEAALIKSIKLVSNAVGIDVAYIWKNDMTGGVLHHTCIYNWCNETGKQKNIFNVGTSILYSDVQLWEAVLSRGDHISGPSETIPNSEKLAAAGIKSVIMIPMFLDDQFWGYFTLGDCTHERDFPEEDISILRSVSLMMASAINRHALIEKRTNELALQTATLNTLLDAIPDHVFVKDKGLRYTYCNNAFLTFFGKRMEDIFGSDAPDLGMPADVAIAHKEMGRKVMREKQTLTFEDESPRTGSNGQSSFFELTMAPLILRDKATGIVVIARDITERKEREALIKTQYEYTKKLTDSLSKITKSSAISYGDLEVAAGVITHEGCVAMDVHTVGVWRLAEDESCLHSLSSFDAYSWKYRVQDDFSLTDKQNYFDLLTTERVIIANTPEECRTLFVVYGDDVCATLDAPIRVDGKLAGVICVEQNSCKAYPDGREWTIEEQNYASSLADLMALAISGFERRCAHEEVQTANQAKTSFLANMSHEIRTPLNVIVGLTDLLMKDDFSADLADDYLEKINTAGTTLAFLINDVLDISKIEAGKLSLVPETYDLASLLNDIITISTVRISDKPITFRLDIDSDLFAELYGDSLRIKQVLLNLLGNAFKYTSAGSVMLSVSCRREDEQDVRLYFAVSDTGMGIRQEDMKKLFVDYSQVNINETRAIEGTGLGLSIVKGLTTLMDGEVSVESEYGRGSIFRVNMRQGFVSKRIISKAVVKNLQSFRYDDSKNKVEKQIALADLNWAKVLVVDDAVTNLDVAKGLLGRYKMQVDCVTCGQDAIDLIKLGQPVFDAIFMDHMMPGLDGIETTMQIRAIDTEYARNIPVIALTANAIAGNEQMFLDEGFQAFLSKPINAAKLDMTIRRWIMKETETPEAGLPASATRQSDAPAGIAGVNMKLGLSLYEGDMDIYVDILRSYAENTQAELDKLRGVSKDTLSDYAIDIHTMKGVSASIGAKGLSERAKKMEKMAKEGDLSGILSLNEEFIQDAQTLIADIQAWLEKNSR